MKFKFVVLGAALVATVVAIQPATAQHCRTGQYYSPPTYYATPTYVQNVVKEVVTPIAYPVIVPAFNFQYVPPTCCNAQQVGVTPGVTPQPMNQPVAQPQQSARSDEDKFRQMAKILVEELRRSESNPPPDQPDDGPPMARPGVSQPPQGMIQQPVSQHGNQHPGLVAIHNACARCHTGSQAKGGVRIFDAPGVWNPGAPKDKMLDAIVQGRMPSQESPEHSRLTQNDVENMRNFLVSAR